ncbi:MAG: conjugative transposon protein TraN [Bacteroidaceae bacterium]|nr:conjugative transposon protein TraN [Prevotellaceae bacterium]MDY5630934.1 conjugative transposon protein TraN [Bacteroidaceae bacterium]
MKQKIIAFATLLGMFHTTSICQETDSIPKERDIRTVHFFDWSDPLRVIFINEDITTHIVMNENIKIVDMSTDRLIGNQVADNIVRIKPREKLYDNEVAGTITVIGERSMVQYTAVYVSKPSSANTIYQVMPHEVRSYINPNVLMPQSDMARYAWAIYSSKRKFNNIKQKKYGIQAVVNNIYTIDDYFFIDFSLYNSSNIKYDIDEIRIKLTDKKESKATNSQTIELQPEFTLLEKKTFRKSYRNILVLKKLTFPDEKILRLEICENQISGRIIYLPIHYEDILYADGFDKSLLRNLYRTAQ